jgi:hypothetical protein
MSSTFIAVQSFIAFMIPLMVNERLNGSKESQEKFLEIVLKTKSEFTRLKEVDNFRTEWDNTKLESLEMILNDAIDYIKKALEEA